MDVCIYWLREIYFCVIFVYCMDCNLWVNYYLKWICKYFWYVVEYLLFVVYKFKKINIIYFLIIIYNYMIIRLDIINEGFLVF